METERTDYYKLEKLCAEERLSAPVGVDYAVSLNGMYWFRFDGCEPSGKFSKSDLMQVEKNVQVYIDKEWHPVFVIPVAIAALHTDTRSPALS